MSMYAEFLKEHSGDDIVENEVGWASYRFIEKSVYIINIYVKPMFRMCGAASSLADEVVKLAKLQNCTELLGTVVPSAKRSTDSLKVLLGYGMTLKNSSNDLIVFRKDI